jgi:hypothetical protein
MVSGNMLSIWDTVRLYCTYGTFVLSVAHVKVSRVINALVALGGVSSLVVGLALKEPATRLISGIVLLLNGDFVSGETIQLSDNTKGNVLKVGWTGVTLDKDGTQLSVTIPNDELLKKRFTNLSRSSTSRVAFEVKVLRKTLLDNNNNNNNNNNNVVTLETVRDAVLEQIEDAVPKHLLQSNTAYWSDIYNGLQIVLNVNCKLNMSPIGAQYKVNQERVVRWIE